MKRSSIISANQRSGYVLLMVLVAIIVSGVALTRLAGSSSRLASEAVYKAGDLQQRWALQSVNTAVLPHIGGVFDARDKQMGRVQEERPPAIIRDEVVLGPSRLILVVADEDAKTNLNSVYHSSDLQVVEKELRRVMEPAAQQAVSLRPAAESAVKAQQKVARRSQGDSAPQKELWPQALGSWGEVFDLAALRSSAIGDRDLVTITKDLTLWGRGRLNVVRASDEAFLSVCRPIVQDGLAKRILDRYRRSPESGIKLIIEKEVVNPRDAVKLQRLLGEGSSCFSLWAESASAYGRKRVFSIVEPDDEGMLRTVNFSM